MQVIRREWVPPTGPLGELVALATERVRRDLRGERAALEGAARAAPPPPSLAAALAKTSVAVIAELKRSSPSKGAINLALNAEAQAAAYAEGGAAALSVLTEPTRFGGSAADMHAARRGSALPLLKKDFHVDPLQIVEARALGASAVLLIARALDDARLAALAQLARELGVEPLVEVRDQWELDAALAAGARVIGVNSRDLETLVIDRATSARVIAQIPPACLAVAESGLRDRADVEAAAAAGADAVLVGSSVSAADEPALAVRRLVGVSRVARVHPEAHVARRGA